MLDANNRRNGRYIRVSVGMISIVILLVLQLIGFAFAYGALNEQVNTNRTLIEQNRILQQDVSGRLNDYNARLARIEAILAKAD